MTNPLDNYLDKTTIDMMDALDKIATKEAIEADEEKTLQACSDYINNHPTADAESKIFFLKKIAEFIPICKRATMTSPLLEKLNVIKPVKKAKKK